MPILSNVWVFFWTKKNEKKSSFTHYVQLRLLCQQILFCFALHPFIKIYRIHWFCVIITHKHTKNARTNIIIFSLCTTYCVPYLNFICIIRRKRKNLCYAYHSFSFHSVVFVYVYRFLNRWSLKMLFKSFI